MGYHKNIIDYYSEELIETYEKICNSNYLTPIFLKEQGLENFNSLNNYDINKYTVSDSLRVFLSSLKKIIKALFIRLDFFIAKIRKNYNSLINKYSRQIQNNKDKINIDKFLHTKINTISYEELEKRIYAVKTLYSTLENIDKIIKSPGRIETPEIEKCLSALTSIGYDPNSQNLVKRNVSNRNYKEKYISTTIENHNYNISKILSILNEIKYLDKYTSNNYVKTINKKFYNLSLEISNNDNPKESQIKTMRLWICTHFIRTTYSLSNDIINDIDKICHIVIKNIAL